MAIFVCCLSVISFVSRRTPVGLYREQRKYKLFGLEKKREGNGGVYKERKGGEISVIKRKGWGHFYLRDYMFYGDSSLLTYRYR